MCEPMIDLGRGYVNDILRGMGQDPLGELRGTQAVAALPKLNVGNLLMLGGLTLGPGLALVYFLLG